MLKIFFNNKFNFINKNLSAAHQVQKEPAPLNPTPPRWLRKSKSKIQLSNLITKFLKTKIKIPRKKMNPKMTVVAAIPPILAILTAKKAVVKLSTKCLSRRRTIFLFWKVEKKLTRGCAKLAIAFFSMRWDNFFSRENLFLENFFREKTFFLRIYEFKFELYWSVTIFSRLPMGFIWAFICILSLSAVIYAGKNVATNKNFKLT